MSTYREIHGKAVKSLGTDPSAETDAGQIWYNTSSDTFKSIVNSATFSSSGNYLAELFGQGGAGSQTAGLSFAGAGSPGSTVVNTTGEYNGYGWVSGGNMGTARRSLIGCGTQTAALGSTGYPGNKTDTEEYDGSSWTGGGAYPVGQELGSGCGTQTAALGCGGQPTPNTSNEYNGSSWTASPGNLNDGRSFLQCVGTQTAALAAGARDSSPLTKNCEEYDGSTWTSVNSLNTSRDLVSFGAGIQTNAISYGTPGSLESYDGTNWTNEPATMGTARNSGSNAGSASTALAVCGSPGGATSLTEEYNNTAFVITGGAWASGGNLNEGRFGMAPAKNAPQTAALCASGTEGPPWPGIVTSVEEYNGTAWSEETNNTTGRESMAGAGTQTAALIFGGSPDTDATEEYDGSSWTNVGDLNTGRIHIGGCGLQTAGLCFGGDPGSPNKTGATEEYNGSAWTTSPGTLNTPRNTVRGCGIQTAALAAGGNTNPPNTSSASAEEYNGTAWTATGSLNTARQDGGACGVQTSALYFSGDIVPGSGSVLTEAYDGTSWVSSHNVATARSQGGSAGSATAGLFFGGGAGGNATEEFTGGTSTINVKTLTQS